LISSESSPTVDSGPDLRPDRGRPTQQGWWAPIARCHIRGSGGHGLKTRGSPGRHPTPNPSRSRGRHCQRREVHCPSEHRRTASPSSPTPSQGPELHHQALRCMYPFSLFLSLSFIHVEVLVDLSFIPNTSMYTPLIHHG
jgi:hypothetical protein